MLKKLKNGILSYEDGGTVACVVTLSVEPSFLQANFRVFVQISRAVQEAESYFPFQSRRRWTYVVQYATLEGCGCQCVVQRGVAPRSSTFVVPSPWPVTMCLRPRAQCSVLMNYFSRFNIMIDRP